MRRLACALLAAASVSGCGSATVDELPPAAGPAVSPVAQERPAGRVVPLRSAPEGVAAARPSATAVAGEGRYRAVLSTRERRLELYDADTDERAASVPAGVGPTHVAAVANRVYVLDTRGEALLIYHLDPELELTRRVHLPGSPYGLALDRRRERLWVTLTATNELVGLDADHRAAEVARLATVRQPDAVAVDSASGTVVVTGRADGVAQLIAADEADGEDQG